MNPFGFASTVGLSAEDAVPRQVVYEILPQLEAMLVALGKLQKIWNTPQNAIPAKIGAAAAGGQALGGYSPADWARWGETLLALNTFNKHMGEQQRRLHLCEVKGPVMDRLKLSKLLGKDLTGQVFLSAAQAYQRLSGQGAA